MATIVYLDIDDEITTAASRIRSATEPKVALVLSPGSRIATSRMNFRLLAREALERNRGLSIVAADPATQSIAASAGLPIFASVAEFEASIAPPAPPPPADEGPAEAVEDGERPDEGVPGRRRRASKAAALGAAGAATAGAAGTAAEAAAGAAGAATAGTTGAVSAGAPGPVVGASSPQGSEPSADLADAGSVAQVVPAATSTESQAGAGATSTDVTAIEPRARSGAATLPVIAAGRVEGRGIGRGRLLALGTAIAIVVVVAFLAATILPSASVVVVPRPVAVGPVELVVRADPDAPGVDESAGVIPAARLSHGFEASGTFTATGKRVVQTKAKGTLRWTNCDPTKAYTIPSGTIAKTPGGVGFATNDAAFLPVAIIQSGNVLQCQSKDVGATAVTAGPSGNVAAGTVTVAPAKYNAIVIEVTNPEAMSGGKRDEFTRISQKDLNAALAQLTKQISDDYIAWLKSPDELAAGTTAFPKTGQLSEPVPAPDPTTLVNDEQESFDLAMTASGSVVAVDTSLVKQVAENRVGSSVPTDHTLVAGSVAVTLRTGTNNGEIVDFQVTASALAIPVLDPDQLRAEIKGKTVDEAHLILSKYGPSLIETWPDWVTTIPTLDFRLELAVRPEATPGAVASPAPSSAPPSSAPSATQTSPAPEPTGSPSP